MPPKKKTEAPKIETPKPEVAAFAPVDGTVLLKTIVVATQGEGGFGYVNLEMVGPLVEAGLVEINDQIKNDAGEIAARATQKGVEFIMGTEEVKTATSGPSTNVPVSGNGFALVSNVPVPDAAKKGGRGGSSYPFEKMDVGHSFFIPVTADKPEPWKQYASTVSSATQRFAEVIPGETREKRTLKVYDSDVADEAGTIIHKAGDPILDAAGKKQYNIELVAKTKPTRTFLIRKVDDGAPWGKPGVAGAGIWRTA